VTYSFPIGPPSQPVPKETSTKLHKICVTRVKNVEDRHANEMSNATHKTTQVIREPLHLVSCTLLRRTKPR
jgi:hypothetical protein